MQTPMFVFAGLRDQRSTGDTKLLLERLEQRFADQQIPISFTRKDELLTSEFEDVSFYVAFLKREKELKDWFQMAEDFELTATPNPIDEDGLNSRNKQKKLDSPTIYTDTHYTIGKAIFAEMNKFSPITIYLFY